MKYLSLLLSLEGICGVKIKRMAFRAVTETHGFLTVYGAGNAILLDRERISRDELADFVDQLLKEGHYFRFDVQDGRTFYERMRGPVFPHLVRVA